MLSILSLIDKTDTSEINRILEAVRPVLVDKSPLIWQYPHITWHSAEKYTLPPLERSITELASSWEKTRIRVTGIGMFTGKVQVLYLPVIKTAALVHMQKQIFQLTKPVSRKPSKFFQPEIWIPHITIISNPNEQQTIPQAIQILSEMNVDFEVEINNLALGQYTGDTADILLQKPFVK
jgi:2'-5' RNA ligase